MQSQKAVVDAHGYPRAHTGEIVADKAEEDCGGYTGLAVQSTSADVSSATEKDILLSASTITGGLYALHLISGGSSRSDGDEWRDLELQCTGLIRGDSIM